MSHDIQGPTKTLEALQYKTLLVTSGTYIRCEQADQVWCDDACNSSYAVYNSHYSSCVVAAQVKGVHLHARVKCTHQTHSSGE